MADTNLHRFKFVSSYSEKNNIGEEGCLHLSKAKWPKLTYL